jgi:signal transduction histidine kinase
VLAWGSLGTVIVLAVVGSILVVLGWETPQPASLFGPRSNALVLGLTFGVTGSIIAARRPENPIGWLLCAAAVVAAIQGLAEAYALWALLDQGGRPPLGEWAAWLDEWFWMFGMVTLGTAAALYPDGRWLSRRWRNAMIVGFVLCGLSILAAAFTPELVIFEGIDNPVGVTGMTVDEYYRRVGIASIGFLVPVVVGLTSAFVRFRRSRGDEREQLKWLTASVGFAAGTLVVYLIAYLATSGTSVTEIEASRFDWVEGLIVLAVLTIPASIAVGVLKYRLYDIDLVITKTVVYGALALSITIVYVAVVVGVGALVGSRGSTFLSAVAAAIVALAFQPLRRRAQHLANRVVYGKRSTPYEVLSGFGERVGETYSIDDVLPRMARLLGEAVGAERVVVWLEVGSGFEPAAGWPTVEGLRRAAYVPDGGFEVRHQGELLGALTVDMPPSEPLDVVGAKLVTDLAGHAGLVLRNARLIEELRASRQRLVAAQDQERRRIERNIHDGAQQQLVALAVRLRMLEQQIDRDPAAARATAASLQVDATTTLEDLRDLARGIYPPLLADKGLSAALEAQARRSTIPTAVDPVDVGRFDQDVETTVYFCVLEALQNVAKYAEASAASVTLSHEDGHLLFEVRDDGRGFDPRSTSYGTGLQGMADRLAALGGKLEVRSGATSGTSVTGRLPVQGAR